MIKKFIISLFICSIAFSGEVVGKRTYNSKTFRTGNVYTTEIHSGHIHYKDAQGNFQPVDFTLEDMGTYWQMKKANYNLYISKTFDDDQLIRYDNKFNGADHTIFFTSHSLQWINRTDPGDRQLIKAAQNVTGYVSGHSIVYENAFGNDIDFVVQLKRHGFQKYIRFNSQPTLNPPSADYVPVLIFKYQGDGLTVTAKSDAAWDGVSFYESIDGFEISEGNYKTYLREAHIWDSADRIEKVKLFFEKRGGSLWQAKVLPKSFFADAIYPVMSDADYGIDDSGDGYVNEGGNATWAGTHDAATGNSANYTSDEHEAADCAYETGPNFFIKRCFLPFSTGGLPDTATITAATLNLYVTTATVDDSDGDDYIAVIQTSQADPTQLTTADYDAVGTTEGSDQILIGNLTTGQYNTWTLDATGRGWIALDGYSYLGIREGHDILDHEIVNGDPQTRNHIRIRYSEYTGTGSDPYLSVTYTVPSQVIIINMN